MILAARGGLPGRFASLLVVFQRLHRTAKHLGNSLKGRLGFRVAEAPDIGPTFLLGLLQHLSILPACCWGVIPASLCCCMLHLPARQFSSDLARPALLPHWRNGRSSKRLRWPLPRAQ